MITIVNPDQFIRANRCKGPVTSASFYQGRSESPHPDGLLSEEIFGLESSPERSVSYSWIELNCPVINPMIYDILHKRIEKKIEPLLSGETPCILDEKGYLTPDENGDIMGMTELYNLRQQWRFRPGKDEEGDRTKLVRVLEAHMQNNVFFMTKLLVVPPTFRPVTIMEETKEVRPDPLNDIYKRIIILSSQIKGVSGELLNILIYKMQSIMKELQEYIRVKIAKKGGMIRNLMLGKRVDFSARSVIAPDPELQLGEVGIPLRIACQIFEPYILYGLTNSKYSHSIPPEFHAAVKKFLGKEVLIKGTTSE